MMADLGPEVVAGVHRLCTQESSLDNAGVLAAGEGLKVSSGEWVAE